MEKKNTLPQPQLLLRDVLTIGAAINDSWQDLPEAPSLADVVFSIDAANQQPLPQFALAMYWLGLKHGGAINACACLERLHPWLPSLGASLPQLVAQPAPKAMPQPMPIAA